MRRTGVPVHLDHIGGVVSASGVPARWLNDAHYKNRDYITSHYLAPAIAKSGCMEWISHAGKTCTSVQVDACSRRHVGDA